MKRIVTIFALRKEDQVGAHHPCNRPGGAEEQA